MDLNLIDVFVCSIIGFFDDIDYVCRSNCNILVGWLYVNLIIIYRPVGIFSLIDDVDRISICMRYKSIDPMRCFCDLCRLF